jgi:hypothetical protein
MHMTPRSGQVADRDDQDERDRGLDEGLRYYSERFH